MGLLEMLPLHVLLVFIFVFINNVALTSPQKTRGKGPPIYTSVPKTSFSCQGRTAGYYADPEAECQAYHMCDPLKKQFSYLCPAYTLFNQKYMVCDHWHAVNCSAAVFYYDLNERIGQVPDKKTKENNIIEGKRQQKLKKSKKDELQKRSRAAEITSQLNDFRQNLPLQRVSKSTHPIVPVKTTQKPITNIPAHFRQPQSTFRLPDTFIETTIHNVRTTKFLTETTTQSQPLTKLTNFHTAPTTQPTDIVLDNSDEDFGSFFHISARGSGQKFKFGQIKKKDSHAKIVNGVKLRPLFEKTKRPTLDKRNFTVAPEIFTPTPTPTHFVIDEGDDIDYDENNSLEGRSLEPDPLVPFLIPPSPDKQNEKPTQPRIPSITPFLVPPPKGPIILEGSNQELRTPLVVSNFFRSFRITPPDFEITPPKFPFSRPNREFFIPAPGLLPPLPGNSISEEQHFSNDPLIPHKMTMTFPDDTVMRRRLSFRINPNCPRCHPAFLKPNLCQPCVIIK